MKSPLRAFPIRWFWVVIFALFSLGIMAGGLMYYQYEQDHIRREKYQELAAIADLKVRQILEWRRERLDDANRITRSPILRKAIMDWLQDPGNPGFRATLLEQFKSEQIEGYGNVLLADPNGRILLSVRPDPAPLSPAGKQALEAAVAGRQAVLGDLFRCPKDDRVRLDLVAPVLDHQGRPLAVVVLKINPDKVLYPLIQSWPNPSRTAETLLVEVEGKDILFLNELRHREKTALSLREPLTQTELSAVQAALGKQEIFEGRDYRGKKVLADLRPVPQSPWFMVTKVDADEILAEAKYRAGITGLFVVTFILLTAAVTAYGYRQRQANLYQALYQTEREQRQAQEEFRTTLYSIGDAVITTDTEGLVKHINPVAERLTGWLEAEGRGKPLEEVFRIINEETRTTVENPVHRVLREGKVRGLANHTLLIPRDGTESPIAASGATIRDENGAVIGVVLVFRDQNEERAAQNALRESEEKYRLLVNQIPAVVFRGYGDWNVDFFDNKIEALTGFPKEEFDSRKIKWCDLILPEDFNNAHRIFIEALKTDKSYVREYRIRKRDGGISWIQAMGRIFCDAAGKVDHIVGVFFDITERKQVEENLRQTRDYLENLISHANAPIIVWDPSFRITRFNRAFENLTGYSAQEVVGQKLDLLFPEASCEESLSKITRTSSGEYWEAVEIPILHKDGDIRIALWNSANIHAEDGATLVATIAQGQDITERKRAEKTIRENEERLRLAQQVANIGTFEWNIQTGVNRWTPELEALYGLPPGGFEGTQQAWENMVHPGDRTEALRRVESSFVVDGSVEGEWRVVWPDSSVHWIAGRWQLFKDESGKPLRLTGVNMDITERKQAEENLRQTRDYLDNLINHANAPIIVWDPSFRITRFNRAFENLTGYSAQEVVGQKLDLLFPEASCEESLSKITRTSSGEYWEAMEIPILHKDGDIRIALWNSANIHAEDGATLVATIAQGQDITERKRAEEAFQVLVNRAPMGIFIIQDGKCQMVNPGFEQVTGYTAKELLGHDSRNLVHPDYREMVRETAIRMLKEKLDLAYEFPIITKSGETRWVIEKVTSTIYRGKRAVLGYFLDISEHKSLEDQFLQAQKMEAVGTLAGGIAHDFNNILTAILGNIGLAVLDDKIGPRVQDRLARAEAACLRAQALSQQLLTFAKGGAPVTKLFSVVELLSESTAFTCVGSPVRCETTFPENLWSIEADPGQIGQVFQNLTINAIQAMPTGGTIKVWAENLTLGTDSDLPLSAGKYIKISMRDQGMGIPAEHLPRIFDPYFTTKQKGSGLGLASAYAIIKKHHGHIAVESKPGVGTTFSICLPAVEQQVTPQPEEDRELLVGKGKILVMDDEEMVREVLGRMLACLGYEAEFARDGGMAIEMFAQGQESGQAFAAVILDLTVPGAMGGKETMARLLELDPGVKAIVSSGYSDDPIMADFQKYGFSSVIAKPYRISGLGKILNKVIIEKV